MQLSSMLRLLEIDPSQFVQIWSIFQLFRTFWTYKYHNMYFINFEVKY
jgi:hypothetical protein